MEFKTSKSRVYMDAGVHEGVQISTIELKVNENDHSKSWVEITFEKPAISQNQQPEIFIWDTGQWGDIIGDTTLINGEFPKKTYGDKTFCPGEIALTKINDIIKNLDVNSDHREISKIVEKSDTIKKLCSNVQQYINSNKQKPILKIKLIYNYYVDKNTLQVNKKVTSGLGIFVDVVGGNAIKTYDENRDFSETSLKDDKFKKGAVKKYYGEIYVMETSNNIPIISNVEINNPFPEIFQS